MKMCLLMYGLLRNVKDSLNRLNTLKNHLNGFELDTYFVTNDICGYHNGESREIDSSFKIEKNEWEKIINLISPKKYTIIDFSEEVENTKSIVSYLKEIYKEQNEFSSPIQNITSKHYKIFKVLELIGENLKSYDIVLFCRMDCQFIPKFCLNQIKQLKSYLHVLSLFWAGDYEVSNHPQDEEYMKKFCNENGYAEDFFYGIPSTVLKFKDYYEFLKIINPQLCRCHPETILFNFIKYNKIDIDLIRWSEDININDFFVNRYSIINKGHSYPPSIINSDWKIKFI